MSVWIGDVYSSDTGWEHVKKLVNLEDGRMAGSESEKLAAEATKSAFEEIGARNARVDEFEFTDWQRISSRIIHDGSGTEVEGFALPRSPSETGHGELIDVGHGLPEILESESIDGKIVIAATNVPPNRDPQEVHRLDKYSTAVENGAAAMILYNHRPGCLPRSGTIRGLNGEPIGEIPIVSTSYETGKKLIRRFNNETITVEVEADIGDGTSNNVMAEVGPDTEEFVIVSCHIDGHDVGESAGDNAVGAGTVLEVGKALVQREDELETRVALVGFGAEEVGFIGSGTFVDNSNIEDIKAIFQNDGAARSRDLKLHVNGFTELRSVVDSVRRQYLDPVHITSEMSLASDHWRFVEQGVPSYAVVSQPDDVDSDPAYGSNSGIVVTPEDTFDKLDPRDLRSHAIIEVELVMELAQESATIPKKTKEEISSLLQDNGKTRMAQSLQLTGKEAGLRTPDW